MRAAPLFAIDGLTNWREVGGLTTADGSRIRAGLLFRADSLDSLSPEAEQAVRDLGVTIIIDLRSADEVAQDPSAPLAGIAQHHVPVGPGPKEVMGALASDADPMTECYRAITEPTSGLPRVLEILAATTAPAVFHCTAGKDRTGVVAAVLQLALGASDELVLAEYEASSRAVEGNLTKMIGRYPDLADRVGAETMRRMAGTDPAWLDLALAPIRQAGSVGAWLGAIGADSHIVDALRQRLLVRL